MADYLPRNSVLLAGWSRNLARNIASAPADWGLTAADAAEITAAAEAYSAALSVTQARSTRCQSDVVRKNAVRRQLIAVLRRYVRRLKANTSLSPARLADVGLHAAQTPRAAVPVPVTRPVLHVMPDAPLRHRLRYTDVAADRRGKPAGVVGLQLFCHVGEKAPAEPLEARFVRLVTRQGQAVDFKPAQMGQSAYYYGRWQTATGETGPWSQVVRMTVAG